MSVTSDSNFTKHLSTLHGGAASFSCSEEGDRGKPNLISQDTSELNKIIARYVVENMLPLSTVGSKLLRALVAKNPSRGREMSTSLRCELD